jgi:poly(hydroxyalkanoate) depolymerase family esterase
MQQKDFLRLMEDATALTRAGDLHAATAAIQHALGGVQVSPDHRGDAIDVDARWVPDADGFRLPAAGLLSPGTNESQDPPASREEQFIAGRFGTGTAAREYKLYVPPAASAAGAGPLPLVVMLHGCTQNPDDFAAGTGMNEAARDRGVFVLYPAQSRKANPQGCWNWFKHSHQARGRGEPAVLAAMVRHVSSQWAIDPARIYVAGLSAGGAMAAILGQTYPDIFAAVGVHSGLPAGVARDLPSALDAMKGGGRAPDPGTQGPPVPTIIVHGDADGTVHPDNGLHLYSMNSHHEMPVETESGRAPAGREWTRRVQRDASGKVVAEYWVVHGAGHAWSGGSARGSYTDPKGPDATAAMLRFFLER